MTVDDWNYSELSKPSPTRRQGWQYLCTETQASRFLHPCWCTENRMGCQIKNKTLVQWTREKIGGIFPTRVCPYHIIPIALSNHLSNMIFKIDAQGCINEVIVIAHPPSPQSKQCRVLSGLCLNEFIRCISLYQTRFRLVESRNNLITSVSFYSI